MLLSNAFSFFRGRLPIAIVLKSNHSPLLTRYISSTLLPADISDSIGGDLKEEPHSQAGPSFSRDAQPRKQHIEIVLNEDDLEERFVKGGGAGGQKINKTNSAVLLVHKPTGIQIKDQTTRSLTQNRKIARKHLIEKLDVFLNGEESKAMKKAAKIRKQKQKRAKRANEKYTGSGEHEKEEAEEEEEEESSSEDELDEIQSDYASKPSNNKLTR